MAPLRAVPLAAVPVAPGGHSPAIFDPSQQPGGLLFVAVPAQPFGLAAGAIRSGPAVC
ncbi:hypothetical protein [Trichloromonas acetexigens]|uniref:hypothetical protein n=1 Tax=Trichloromonas acetexigens TaxID=38815 RepID=UPI00147883B4|nr:hypothetical protein [Desulfuromonas acetexigens]